MFRTLLLVGTLTLSLIGLAGCGHHDHHHGGQYHHYDGGYHGGHGWGDRHGYYRGGSDHSGHRHRGRY